MSHKVIIRCDFIDCPITAEFNAQDFIPPNSGWVSFSKGRDRNPYDTIELCPEHAKLITIPVQK